MTETESVEVGGVACYIRSNICYSKKTCLYDNLENIFIDLLFPKIKPTYEGIIYKPPHQTWFLEQMITEFESLELNNKLYILGDFNRNLLFLNKMENAFLMKLAELKIIVKAFPPKLKNTMSFVQYMILNNWLTVKLG